MIKIMLAAAGLSLGMLMMPVATPPVRAGVDIDINIGRERISCYRGKRIVENYGFRRVRPQDCSGRRYSYLGRRRYNTFLILVDSRRGRVVDIRELDDY